MPLATLRLGHITYSNCFPVHARLLDRPRPGDPELVPGTPAELNTRLERGGIDAAPCSSIEFARHADRYRVLPGLVIGSVGPVRSILLLSRRPPAELQGARVALPTASATSVVLLKILLCERWNVQAEFTWFDQATNDPFADGADAALFIGDVALRAALYPAVPWRVDLGQEWTEHTGLPFAFAVWQTRGVPDPEARTLKRLLMESRDYGLERRAELAARHAASFGLPAEMLADYWAGLRYELDAEMERGLMEFYRRAAAIGEIAAAPSIRWAG